MKSFINHLIGQQVVARCMLALPLLAAILLEAHVRFTSARNHGSDHLWLSSNPSFNDYFLIALQLVIQSLPMSWALLQTRLSSRIAMLIGFVCYPAIVLLLNENVASFEKLNLMSMHFYLVAVALVSTFKLVQAIQNDKQQHAEPKTKVKVWLAKLLSLNSVVAICLFTWVFLISGAFHYHDDPFYNMPINLIIDPAQIVTDPLPFLNYFWQFGVIALVLAALYLVNRYVLIKQVLSKYGVFNYVLAGFIFWLVFTPLAGQVILSIPMTPPHFTFLPSENFDVFHPDNYKISLLMLFLSTPLILAFERQQDVANAAEITEQKTQAELQLLQQQINPHFLFNTMNSLYALTLKKSDQAPDMVMQLSDMLRYTVYDGQNSLVSLQQEIDYLKNYLQLQQTRLGHRVHIDTQWPEQNTKELNVAPLLFIVLLENAFKHGPESNSGETSVRIAMTIQQNQGSNKVIFSCENSYIDNCEAGKLISGQADKTQCGGLGLRNLQKRLTLQYPNKHTFSTKQFAAINGSSQAKEKRWQTSLELTV